MVSSKRILHSDCDIIVYSQTEEFTELARKNISWILNTIKRGPRKYVTLNEIAIHEVLKFDKRNDVEIDAIYTIPRIKKQSYLTGLSLKTKPGYPF